jgi:hypothetical protein
MAATSEIAVAAVFGTLKDVPERVKVFTSQEALKLVGRNSAAYCTVAES